MDGRPLGPLALRRRGWRAWLHGWLQPAAPWVALLGVDGSGKSTVLAELARSRGGAGYTGLFVLHRRPNLLYPAAEAGRAGQIDHYRKAPHGGLLSAAKLALTWLDWLLGYVLLIHGRRARGVLVVTDRHALLDMLVDPARYRYGGPARWVRLVMRCLPMPDGVILLDAPTAVLQARKQELSAEKAADLRRGYLALARRYGRGFVVDASQPLEQVAGAVWQLVLKIEAGEGGR